MFINWLVSVIAVFGSLYFSEIKQFPPCTLCWYQRIIMYPLVIILGISIIKKDFKISLYTLVLSSIGIIISAYHYAIQKISFFADKSIDCGDIPCTGEYINWGGFITIPFLALNAFLIIFICSYCVLKSNTKKRSINRVKGLER